MRTGTGGAGTEPARPHGPANLAVGSLLTVLLCPALLAGCGVDTSAPPEGPPGPVRQHWQLGQRVPESRTVRVVGQRLDDYGESTRVSFASSRSGTEVGCSVTFSTAGWGGPEHKVGEQVATTVRGRPAVRNGAGAEGDYLLWQRSDGTWAESLCDEDGQQTFQDRLAALVTDEPTDLVLPFDVAALPRGLRVSSIEQDRPRGTTVHLGGPAEDVGRTESDLVLTVDGALDPRPGRATVIGGHPATVVETKSFPGVCLEVRTHDVCVGASSSDTDPFSDRSDELPVILAVAEALRFPVDLDDRRSWVPAQDVFG